MYLSYFSEKHIILSDGKTDHHLYAKENECFDYDTIESILQIKEIQNTNLNKEE